MATPSPIQLFGSQPAWGNPDLSPFVAKLETWLRMAGLPYEKKRGNPPGAPKGKIPYVIVDGVKLGDSQKIIEELTQRHQVQLDAHLTPQQKATALAVRRMVEEGLYFVLMRARWIEPDGWVEQQKAFGGMVPAMIRPFLLPFIRGKVREKLDGQGTGRHSRDEALAIGVADLQALETILGDQPFLLGEQPTSVDATVYAFLSGAQKHPVDSPLRQAASTPRLLAYVERMQAKYWN